MLWGIVIEQVLNFIAWIQAFGMVNILNEVVVSVTISVIWVIGSIITFQKWIGLLNKNYEIFLVYVILPVILQKGYTIINQTLKSIF